MIGLFFNKYDDYFSQIIEWLYRFDVPFISIDLDEIDIESVRISIDPDEIEFNLREKSIKLNDLSHCFYRSSGFRFKKKSFDTLMLPEEIGNNYLRLEFNTLVDFIYSKIREKGLGWADRQPLNKLTQLREAKSCGLDVPNTRIINTKEGMAKIFGDEPTLVKAVQENIGIQLEDVFYYQRASLVSNSELTSHSFFPTLVQEPIEKLFEVRTFYLDSNFYSIAIFDIVKKGGIDMRDNYQNHVNLKFELPTHIREKLEKFMQTMRLKFGMIDMIYSKEERFYFLEVNTEGQYDWLSNLGGYNLHKKIAEYLRTKYLESNVS